MTIREEFNEFIILQEIVHPSWGRDYWSPEDFEDIPDSWLSLVYDAIEEYITYHSKNGFLRSIQNLDGYMHIRFTLVTQSPKILEELVNIVLFYEDLSKTICEQCGERGYFIEDWGVTRCEKHLKEFAEKAKLSIDSIILNRRQDNAT